MADRAAKFAAACERATGLTVKRDVPGARWCTFSIGGPFSFFCDVDSIEELKSLTAFLRKEGAGYRVLGGGSNLLIADEGVRDVVIKLGRAFRFLEKGEGNDYVAGASTPLMTISRSLSDAGLSGLEFAGGIPASLGGALYMNAGAHGSCMGNIVESARVMLPDGEVVEMQAHDFSFAYRHSGIPAGSIVLSMRIALVPSDRDRVQCCRREMLAERKVRQPLKYASAGSVFRNPSPETPAGMLIENAGLKGSRIGGAEISTHHANWIVNPQKTATASDVLALMELCMRTVFEVYGIRLKPEIVIWQEEEA